ncbi:MAG: hypothetical protein KH026_11970 [Clostridium sp.]|nr:hypothetical protein [Clostridium sp.]
MQTLPVLHRRILMIP